VLQITTKIIRHAVNLGLLKLRVGLIFSAALSFLSAEVPLRFCAYNIKNWITEERWNREQVLISKSEAEKQQVIQMLKQVRADILGICEIGRTEDLEDFITRLKQVGLEYPYHVHCQQEQSARTLALLSKKPIVHDHSQTKLEYELNGQRLPMQRGILDVEIEVAAGEVWRFIGVHLKSKRLVDRQDQALMRRHESALLRAHCDEVIKKNPQVKLLVYGDLNETQNISPIITLKGRQGTANELKDLNLKDTQGQGWTHYWQDAEVYSKIDYILVNEQMRTCVDIKASYIHTDPAFEKASDHRPLVVGFKDILKK
jgi:endonuclease/exonuclease/phosphatase family metal-dependent hydrolase